MKKIYMWWNRVIRLLKLNSKKDDTGQLLLKKKLNEYEKSYMSQIYAKRISPKYEWIKDRFNV